MKGRPGGRWPDGPRAPSLTPHSNLSPAANPPPPPPSTPPPPFFPGPEGTENFAGGLGVPTEDGPRGGLEGQEIWLETVGLHRKEDPGGYGLRIKVTSSGLLPILFRLGFGRGAVSNTPTICSQISGTRREQSQLWLVVS